MEGGVPSRSEPKTAGPITHQPSNPSSCAVSETTSSVTSPISPQSPGHTPFSHAPLDLDATTAAIASTTSAKAETTDSQHTPQPSCYFPGIIIRDFAYPSSHPLHHGPPSHDLTNPSKKPDQEDSETGDGNQSLHDAGGWGGSSRPAPDWNPDAMYDNTLPSTSFGDGPPYSEDEDLHSPILITTRRRNNKSVALDGRASGALDGGNHGGDLDNEKGIFVGGNGDGTETYYMPDEDAVEDGPGGEYVTYDDWQEDDSRLSRDFQFSITSPDEEMHGKAIALFDFQSMHENELPLHEGQVILVSYRHGEGWLVAEDPKTGESGLVPEAYVRLARHIEGGLNSLNGEQGMETESGQSNAAVDDADASRTSESGTGDLHTESSEKENIQEEKDGGVAAADSPAAKRTSGGGSGGQVRRKPLSIDCTKQNTGVAAQAQRAQGS